MIARAFFATFAPGGRRTRLTVLIFHRVLPQPDPLLPGVPEASEFEAQMRWISEWFNVLPLDEAIERLSGGGLPPRSLAITFDDGYADNHEIAAVVLRRHGLTATFFIASGFLGGGRMFNDTVIEAVRRIEGPSLDLRRLGLGVFDVSSTEAKVRTIVDLLNSVKYLPEPMRSRTVAEIEALSPESLPRNLMMSPEQVKDLKRQGMSIGAHTVSHPILRTLSSAAARAEIAEGKAALESIIADRVELFAYPNGKPGVDYDVEHVAMVRSLGFSGAVSTAWGAARAGDDRYQVPRFTPWDRGRNWFALRLARNFMVPVMRVA
jgi:peptidoglycan/xylan/chitin deacetylase (PgdA/CDA1 family)